MDPGTFIDGETLVVSVRLADADAAIIPPQSVTTTICDASDTTYVTSDHTVTDNLYVITHPLSGTGRVKITWTVVDDEGNTVKKSANVLALAEEC